jgi:3-oxoacyl-[acyl-carrier protein] reductase
MSESKKQVAIIFGGSGGIGSALAKKLQQRDYQLFLVARSGDRLDQVASELGADIFVASATEENEVEGAFEEAMHKFGQIDAVANCVGSILLKPAHATSLNEWQETFTTNATSSFLILRSAVKAMTGSGGSIALVSSVAASYGLGNHEAIAAAKAAVEGLTRSVAPGLVDTPLSKKLTGSEVALKASRAMHPLGRIGAADEIASALAWFLSPEQSWVTGQVLGVDGGMGRVHSRQIAM